MEETGGQTAPAPIGPWAPVRAGLPEGGVLNEERWQRRHRRLVAVQVTLPLLLLALVPRSPLPAVPTVILCLGLSALGLAGLAVRGRAAAVPVAIGLAGYPTALFAVSGGTPELLVMYVIALGAVSLYQEWVAWLTAQLVTLVGVFLVVSFGTDTLTASQLLTDNPAAFVTLHVAVMTVAGVLSLMAWGSSEREQRIGEESMRESFEVQRQMLEQMTRTEELKDALLGVVSHEFRTPLTAILGFSQIITQTPDPSTLSPDMVVMAADRIEQNGLRLSRLIGNMLAATTDVRPHLDQPFPIGQAISDVVQELSGADEDPTQVELDLDETLTARMSRDHLRLLVGNLVDNGMKFADPGTPLTIRARPAGDEVAMVFTNHGPEIPEDMREQIFARFVQVEMHDTRSHDGLGLGLHVVRRLCDAYGGGLELRCQDGLVVLGITLPAGPRREPASGHATLQR